MAKWNLTAKFLVEGTDQAATGLRLVTTTTSSAAKETDTLKKAMDSASTSLEKFGKTAESGGARAERQLGVVMQRTKELERAIASTRAQGGPVPPEAEAELVRVKAQTEQYMVSLAGLRAEQERARREMEVATRAAGGFAGGIKNDHQLLESINPQLGEMALRVGLMTGALTVAVSVMKEVGDEGFDMAKELGAGSEAVDKMKESFDSYMKLGAGGVLKSQLETIRTLVQTVHQLYVEYGGIAGIVVEAFTHPVELLKNLGKAFNDAFVTEGEQDAKKAEQSTNEFMRSLEEGAKKQTELAKQRSEAQQRAQEEGKRALAEFQRQIAERERLRSDEAKKAEADAQRLIQSLDSVAQASAMAFTKIFKSIQSDIAKQNEAWAANMSRYLHAQISLWNGVLEDVQKALAAQNQAGAAIIHQNVSNGQQISDWLASPAEDLKRRLAEIEQAIFANEEDRQAAILKMETEFWLSRGDEVANGLAYLGHAFGGFIGQLAGWVSQIQSSASGMSQAFSNIASGLGASGSTVSAAGGIGAVIGVMYAIYDAVDKSIQQRRAQSFGDSSGYSLVNNQVGVTETEAYSHQVTSAITNVLREFEDALRIDVRTLDSISIKVRNDGKYVEAWVKGVMVGHFQSVDEAIQAALRVALQNGGADIAGMSDLMKQALTNLHFDSLDELKSFLQQMQEIGDMAKPEGVVQAEQLAHHIEELFQTLLSMPPTPAVVEGIGNLLGGLTSGLTDLYNQLTGHTRSIQEEQEARAAAYNAQRAIVLAQLQLMKLELEARIAEYNIRRQLIPGLPSGATGGGGGAGGGGGPGFNTGPPNNGFPGPGAPSVNDAKVLGKPPVQAPNPANPNNDPALQALLDSLAAIIAAIGGLPGALKPGDVKVPRSGRGGGSGQTYRDAQQFYQDQQRALAEAGKGATQQQIDDIHKKYDEEIKAAGKHHDLVKKLQDQENEAIKQALDAAKKSANDNLANYIGKSGFDQERDRAQALKDQFKDIFTAGGLSAREYAAKLAEVDAAERQHMDTLGRQETAGLFQSIAGLMEQVGGDIATGAEHAQMLHDANVANFEIQLAAAQAKAAELEAEGYLTGAAAARVDAILARLAGLDPEKLFPPGTTETVTTAMSSAATSASKIQQSLADALAKLKQFTDSLLLDERLTTLSPQQQEAEARRQLAAAEAAARTGNPQAISDLQNIERQVLEVFRRNEASGQSYQDLFAYIIQLNNTLQNIPHYAQGGVTARTQLALLHPNEAVIPLRGGGVPVANDNKASREAMLENIRQRSAETAALHKELTALRAEVAGLRREQKPKPREVKRRVG